MDNWSVDVHLHDTIAIIHLISVPEGKQNLFFPEGQGIKCFVIWREELEKRNMS